MVVELSLTQILILFIVFLAIVSIIILGIIFLSGKDSESFNIINQRCDNSTFKTQRYKNTKDTCSEGCKTVDNCKSWQWDSLFNTCKYSYSLSSSEILEDEFKKRNCSEEELKELGIYRGDSN